MKILMFRMYDGPYYWDAVNQKYVENAKELGWVEATNQYDAIAKARVRWPNTDPQCSEYGQEFENPPHFENHMIHWPMWAEKFKDAPGETGVLARMLQMSLDDKESMLKKYRKTSARYTALFFAFIETVDRLPIWARWAVKTPKVDGSAGSVGGAFRSIQQINAWRKANKYNIKEWDDA